MDSLSERAQALLGRYREADALPDAGRERIVAGVAERIAHAEAPPPEVDIAPPQPVTGLAAGTKVLICLAAGVLTVPLIAGLVGGRHDTVEQPPPSAPAIAPVPEKIESPAVLPAAPPEEDAEPELREPDPPPQPDAKQQRRKPTPQVLTIDAELKLLKAAQAALRAGDADRALVGLAKHQRRFPNGKLADLREVVRIEALCRLGRNNEAQRASRKFLRKRPGSPHSHRVRAACEGISQ